MTKKVLVLAAHPDDETLGCGGTINYMYKRGYEIMLITFTDGTGARIDTSALVTENRNDRLDKVAKRLGIAHVISGTFPDNRMDTVALLDVVKFIEETMKTYKFKPNFIFTHHPDCLNVDHSTVYKATITAFRPQNINNRQQIYSYYIPSSTDYNPLNQFQGNTYFRLKLQHMSAKMEVLNQIYPDELRKYPHSRSSRNIENLMQVWGSEIGQEYAEKFQLIRSIN
jgi:LmbE family N-acetylglucosaminyl deacetylase